MWVRSSRNQQSKLPESYLIRKSQCGHQHFAQSIDSMNLCEPASPTVQSLNQGGPQAEQYLRMYGVYPSTYHLVSVLSNSLIIQSTSLVALGLSKPSMASKFTSSTLIRLSSPSANLPVTWSNPHQRDYSRPVECPIDKCISKVPDHSDIHPHPDQETDKRSYAYRQLTICFKSSKARLAHTAFKSRRAALGTKLNNSCPSASRKK